MYEHIPGVWTRTCGETLSQNRTECVHAPQKARQRGTVCSTPPRVSDCFHWHRLQLHHIYKVQKETMILKLQPIFFAIIIIINVIIH